MKDTPETDAKIIWFGGWEDNRHVPANFARKLERERDEAIQRRMETILQCELLEKERDEAREIIRMAKTKFCEEGSDGNIASDMFAILSSGGIAQWLEQSAHNRLVVGSNPSVPM